MRKLVKTIKEGALFAATEGLIRSKKMKQKLALALYTITKICTNSYKYLQFAEIFFVL